MATPQLPGTDAARHAPSDIDLTLMMVFHDAFRRDLVSLTRAANRRSLADPARRLAVHNGWDVFKRQLHIHHQNEDVCLWPPLRERLGHNPFAMSTLDAMEHEHGLVDPLLAAVDHSFTDPPGIHDDLADVIGELATALTHHLGHEERDTLPLIGMTLTIEEWAGVSAAMGARGSVAEAMEMVPWMLDHAPPETVARTLGLFPPVVQQSYHSGWKPTYDATPHW